NQGIRPPLHRRQWRCSSLKYTSMFDSSCLTGVARRRPRCTCLFCGGPQGPAAKSPGHSAAAASAPVALLVAQIHQDVRLLVPYWRRASAPSVHLFILRRAPRARREITRAFGRRCIGASGVARRSNTPVCSTPRALLASRLGALGAPGYFAAGPYWRSRRTIALSYRRQVVRFG